MKSLSILIMCYGITLDAVEQKKLPVPQEDQASPKVQVILNVGNTKKTEEKNSITLAEDTKKKADKKFEKKVFLTSLMFAGYVSANPAALAVGLWGLIQMNSEE